MNDFIHHFQGFWGTEGRCHIRMLDEENKPLVIICSQGFPVRGTSITNAVDDLYGNMQQYLMQSNLTLTSSISSYLENKRWSKILLDLIEAIRGKSITEFTLESLKIALEKRENFKNREDKIRNLIWVEHYPKTIHDSPWHMIVSFADDTWTPSWRPVTLEELACDTKYTIEQLDIPEQTLARLWD